MKIGAIIEVNSIRRADLRHRLVTLVRPFAPTVAEDVLEAVIALIATLNHSRHGAGQRFALLMRRKSSTYGVDYAGR